MDATPASNRPISGRAGLAEDRSEHGGRESSRMRVLAARMVGGDDAPGPGLVHGAMRECRPWRDADAALGHQAPAGVEGHAAQRDEHPRALERVELRPKVAMTGGDFLRAWACCREARTGPRRQSTHPGAPAHRRCFARYGWLARPFANSAAMRKSLDPPTPSPVKLRPVRFAPCAAGARPTRTMRAAGSPKPGTGRAQ